MTDANKSNAFQELAPIICGNCGSAVPLVDAETVPCIYCSAQVEIPATYRRGQEAKKRLASIRSYAGEFLARLGSRPQKWEIWLTLLPSWAFFVILMFLTLTGYSSLLLFLEFSISRMLGTNLRDFLPEAVVWPLYGGTFFVFLVMAMAVFFLVRRRVFVTRRLMSVLAAGEPVKPGGPATCRRCGGPFEARANELVAACEYCGSENFLHVPPDWLSATRRLSTASGRNVFWAEREYEREMTSSRTSFRNQLMLYGFFLLFIVGAFISGDSKNIKVWSRDVAARPRIIHGLSPEIPGPQPGVSFRMYGVYRKWSGTREFQYEVALKAGEVLKVSLAGPGSANVAVIGRYDRQRYTLDEDQPVEFKAGLGGWFKLQFGVKNGDPLPVVQISLN